MLPALLQLALLIHLATDPANKAIFLAGLIILSTEASKVPVGSLRLRLSAFILNHNHFFLGYRDARLRGYQDKQRLRLLVSEWLVNRLAAIGADNELGAHLKKDARHRRQHTADCTVSTLPVVDSAPQTCFQGP